MTNYEKAKLVLARKKIVMKFYNTYKTMRTLKVFFFDKTAEETVEANRMHDELIKLADSWDETDRGGVVYRFKN